MGVGCSERGLFFVEPHPAQTSSLCRCRLCRGAQICSRDVFLDNQRDPGARFHRGFPASGCTGAQERQRSV